jgi:hypothetical protein
MSHGRDDAFSRVARRSQRRGRSSACVLCIAFLFVSPLWGATGQSAQSAADEDRANFRWANYEFSFSVVEDTVIPIQPIWIRLGVRNLTDRELPRPWILPGTPLVSLDITDQTGARPPVSLAHFDVRPGFEFSGRLAPRQKSEMFTDLGVTVWGFSDESAYRSFWGSHWSVTLCFDSSSFGPGAGPIPKPIADTLMIAAPAGVDLEATTLYSNSSQKIREHRFDQSADLARKITQLSPSSRLAPLAYRRLGFLATDVAGSAGRADYIRKLSFELLRKRPDSPDLIVVSGDLSALDSGRVYRSFLDSVRVRCPSSPILIQEKWGPPK